MHLNDLLISENINPVTVLVMRHRPHEHELRKVLPWLAAEKPDVYNAYQQTQGPRVEKAMTKAEYVASFIGHASGKALFVGLYKIKDHRPLTYRDYWKVSAFQEMKVFGMRGLQKEDHSTILWFDLELVPFHTNWKGKLIVDWPGLERSWWRWSDRNKICINAILEESLLDEEMPEWDKIILNWEELSILPSKWKAALSEWRGVYFIWDSSDGRGYVGSAYGSDNLYGRWLNYAKSGHGGDKLLRKRDPQNFKFSILQRVSPDMEPTEVIQLEGSWKDRLHTRKSGLNAN